MNGFQNACGSTAGAPAAPGAWLMSRTHACVPSSICFFQRSMSCWFMTVGPHFSSTCLWHVDRGPLGYGYPLWPLTSAPLRAPSEPGSDLGPAVHRGAAARDQRDVAARQLDVLAVRAAHGVDEGPHARRRRDVVLLRTDREHRARDALEVDGLPAQSQLAADQPVLLVELLDPLPEE